MGAVVSEAVALLLAPRPGALELVDADLQAERLVVPFDFSTTSPRAYYVVYPKGGLGSLGQRFRDWIIAKASEQ